MVRLVRLEGGCVMGEVGVCVMGLEVGGWEEVPTFIRAYISTPSYTQFYMYMCMSGRC